jgi:hypothetical protein
MKAINNMEMDFAFADENIGKNEKLNDELDYDEEDLMEEVD